MNSRSTYQPITSLTTSSPPSSSPAAVASAPPRYPSGRAASTLARNLAQFPRNPCSGPNAVKTSVQGAANKPAASAPDRNDDAAVPSLSAAVSLTTSPSDEAIDGEAAEE